MARKFTALCMAVGFCAWLTASALFTCPFLQADMAFVRHPCCPKTNQTPRCPLSKSIEDCPFYVTESKIGVTETIQHVDVPLVAVSIAIPVSKAVSIHKPQMNQLRDGPGLNLRNCVLLI
jgi:hypothetical protein